MSQQNVMVVILLGKRNYRKTKRWKEKNETIRQSINTSRCFFKNYLNLENNLILDPIFIISIIGIAASMLVAWIISETKEGYKDNFVASNSSTLSTVFGLMMLYSIFINAGDLSIVLLVGSVISLLVLLVGFFLKTMKLFLLREDILFLFFSYLS